MRYCFTGRKTSGNRVRMIAASTEPEMLPMPPSTTIAMTSMLLMKVKELGLR